jgi:hypothetical protein
MNEKRIATVRIKTVLKKLFTNELHEVERLIVAQSDFLNIVPNPHGGIGCIINKDLFIDFLIDYKNALENEIRELKEKPNGD